MLNLTLLGCGGGIPMPNRFLSSLLINYKGHKILVDCGEGTQISMRMVNSGFKNIDLICITHIHSDHIAGLPGILESISNSGRTEKLIIIGPKKIKDTVNALKSITSNIAFNIEVIEEPKETITFMEDITIDTIECNHLCPCLGYSFYLKRLPKFDIKKAQINNVPKVIWHILQKQKEVQFEGKIYTNDMVLGNIRKGLKISMITDTRPENNMIDFIKNSDLFICEATYKCDDDMEKALKNKHMLYREAAELAKGGNVKKLLLTHFSTAIDNPAEYINNASSKFKNTIIGYDHYKIVLNFEEDF